MTFRVNICGPLDEAGYGYIITLLLEVFTQRNVVARLPLLVSENYSDCTFVWYQNIRSTLFGFVTKHACDRQDGRTGGQTEFRLPRPRQHSCLCGKNSRLESVERIIDEKLIVLASDVGRVKRVQLTWKFVD